MILLHHAKIQKRFFDVFYNNWKVRAIPAMVKDAKKCNFWRLRDMGTNWTEINRILTARLRGAGNSRNSLGLFMVLARELFLVSC